MQSDPEVSPPLLFSHCSRVFAGHRGFPLRLGWLRKVHVGVQANPALFSPSYAEHAVIDLGVGRSLVPALKYWSSAFGLIRETGAGSYAVTRRGRWLLDYPDDGPGVDHGADPWIEKPETLWLLHWWLGGPGCVFPTWLLLFSRVRFQLSREQLINDVLWACRNVGWVPPSPAQVGQDAKALVAMYRSPSADRGRSEDDLAHPFRQLGLLGVDARGDLRMHRHVGPLTRGAIVAYACADYAARTAPDVPLSLARVNEDPTGPGRLMLASPATIRVSLQAAVGRTSGAPLCLTESVGDSFLSSSQPWNAVADALLAEHYGVKDGPGPFTTAARNKR